MFETIIKASENFCIHQIREPYNILENTSNENMFITYIDIDTPNNTKHRVYIASSTNIIQKISTIFLEEEKSDNETLIDMALETTNLIVGSAKVIAEDANINLFTINTPHFMEIKRFNLEYDSIKTFQIEDGVFIVAIKELNV